MSRESSEKLVISVQELRELLERSEQQRPQVFALGPHFNSENIVEIAKSQFPVLEAEVAKSRLREETERINAELRFKGEMERTKRLLIIVAATCLIVGAALVVFAPSGKEGVSYVVAALLGILPLGAIGVQEFRIRTIGVNIEAGKEALRSSRSTPSSDE
jgi:hypothetical protein